MTSIAASDDLTIDVRDPATGQSVGWVRDQDGDDAAAAVDRAAEALVSWRRMAPRLRSDVLRRVFEIMTERAGLLAELVVRENGKVLADARAEIQYAAEFFRWYSEEAVRSTGTYGVAPDGLSRTLVSSRPVGVAALVTPWNFPAAMIARKVAPALAAGCTVVVKPAEETPLTAIEMLGILREAGVPDGVVEIVTTSRPQEVVDRWLSDPRVRKVSFTGSTAVGKALLRQAADRVMASSMELGGNAPFIVAADADLDRCVEGALVAKLRGGGQACTAANTFFVDRAVVEEFTARLGRAVGGLVVGPGDDPATDIGPLISGRAVARIEAAIDDAVGRGASVTHRGVTPVPGRGHFLPPTVVLDVPLDSPLVTQEIFGPVAPVVAYDTIDDVIDHVNGLDLGLAAYIYSADLRWAIGVADRLECGMVGINRGVISDPSAPFGGMKESGLGREGSVEGLAAFQETQYVSVDWT